MNKLINNVIENKYVFLWIAVFSGLILLIPLVAMQFTSEVNWNYSDFLVMGIILTCGSSLFVITARIMPKNKRLLTALLFLAAFLYVWAELAVGIFTG